MLVPLRSWIFRSSMAMASVALIAAGCDGGGSSGSTGTSTGTDTGDGKYHPSPDGTHISEKDACDALVNEQSKRLLALHCVGTGPTCPSFLLAQFQTACMQYDKGSVEGCLAYYDQQASCAALKEAFDACVITPYPGTEPAGCPVSTGGAAGTGGAGGSGGSGGMTGSGGSGGMTGSGGSGGMTGSGGSGGVMSGSGGSGGVMSGSSSGSGM